MSLHATYEERKGRKEGERKKKKGKKKKETDMYWIYVYMLLADSILHTDLFAF